MAYELTVYRDPYQAEPMTTRVFGTLDDARQVAEGLIERCWEVYVTNLATGNIECGIVSGLGWN